MSPNKETVFLKRRLHTLEKGGVTLLEATQETLGKEREIRLFFKAGTPTDAISPGAGLLIEDMRTINDGPMLTCRAEASARPVEISVGKTNLNIQPEASETDLFAGLNTIFAVRNGESSDVVADWLTFHVTHHDAEAVLILNRANPKTDKNFFNRLKKQVRKLKGLKRLVVLDATIPLGQPDLGDEAHPFNVPGAPGKDRMKIPDPEPWKAPLGDVLIYELVRARFLNTARAVANIDVYDLLALEGGKNIFDRAVEATTGALLLKGVQIYPWRIRGGDSGHFGDHICVQFDSNKLRKRWCVAPNKLAKNTVWRLIRVVGTDPTPEESAGFYRCMALRHPAKSVSKIVPKTSLTEDAGLVRQAIKIFNHKPVRAPVENLAKSGKSKKRDKAAGTLTTIVTTMKNEGPFILEWIAYHRAIGVEGFLIYTNDCTDGTDTMLELLQSKGFIQHRENPFHPSGKLKPQHAALQAAESEDLIKKSDWLICMDVDEFINIHTGSGTLSDLYKATKEANMISLTWRLFGNSNIHEFQDIPICDAFTRCAPELARKPHQAWGFKTLFRNLKIFKKLGVHRPKGLKPQLYEDIRWVNGSGSAMPQSIYRNGWRSTMSTYGYALVTLNHYAVRSAESFLVKRDRGRVNHVDRDQGLSYWFRMNNNAETDLSIKRMLPAMRAELDKMMADPEIAAAHDYSVHKHREKIDALKATDAYANFYKDLTGRRLEKLSCLHANFGANVFLMGPDVIPDEVSEADPNTPFLFTVEKGDTNH